MLAILKLCFLVSLIYADEGRVLKGGRSGGGSRGGYSSSRSSYSKSSSGYSSSGKSYSRTAGMYQTSKSPVTNYNTYWDKSTGKTYAPLYNYYKPANYRSAVGYYSPMFLIIYYDGYGYNFYYGEYGYYEYSVNEREQDQKGTIIFVGLILAICCLIFFRYMCKKGCKSNDNDE